MLDVLDAPELPNSHGRSVLPLLRSEDAEWQDIAFSEYCTDENCLHRMIRYGDWKLNYYHGQPLQLFNLKEDPHELHDRAQDSACREIREELTRKLLEGWNPDVIGEKMKAKRADLRILSAWARHTKPEDKFRWNLLPEMDYLD
jgi:arylsulfatase A-like enzyme